MPDPRPLDRVSMAAEPTRADVDLIVSDAAAPETAAVPMASVPNAMASVVMDRSGVSTDPFPGAGSDELAQMVRILSSAFQDLLQTPGWSILPNASIRCPNDQRLFPFSVAKAGNQRPKSQIIYMEIGRASCRERV